MSDTFTGETYNTLCNDAEGYLANESPEQARELLQKAISLIGTRPRGRSLLADTCMSMELWAEARSQLEILITLDEGNINNNFRLAQVLEELGEYQLALDNFSVVLDDDPDHHGANVAIKRIEARTNDSGVNLADIFNSPKGAKSEETSIPDYEKDNFKEEIQIFPDEPSDNIFADSEENEEASVDLLLQNIGISSNSTEEEENDVSELLENIGVSTSQALQSAFADSDESEREGTTELQEDTGEKKEEVKKPLHSLDEIFGATSSTDEEETAVEPEVEEREEEEAEPGVEVPEVEETEPEAEEPGEEEPEETDKTSPFVPSGKDTVESSDFSFSSSKTLESIFNAPKPEEKLKEETVETVAEAEEPEEEEAEEVAREEEPVAEAEEPEEEEAEEVAGEEEPEAEAEEPEEVPVEDTSTLTVVMKQDADFRIDPWSPESGLITIHMTSGTVSLKKSMLSIYEKPLKIQPSEKGTIELSGEGTFLLNCGPEEPLIVEVKENMVIRKDAVVLHTGTLTTELLDITDNDSIYVIKEKTREKAIFIADHPVRIILLGGNNRIFYVRTTSIIAADPEILLSHAGTPEGYTEVTGLGKVYLIE